jgi:hypothetical protein
MVRLEPVAKLAPFSAGFWTMLKCSAELLLDKKLSLWIFSSLGLTVFRLEASKEFSSGNGWPGQKRGCNST